MKETAVYRASKKAPGAGMRLAEGLDAYVIVGLRKPIYYPTKVIFNWGRSKIPVWEEGALSRGIKVINNPKSVYNAVNKIRCFEILKEKGIPTPIFTTSKEEAKSFSLINWVFCRTLINSSKGRGIVIARSPEEIVDSPLYTELYPKTHELRVHVAFGRVIDIVEKKKRTSKKLEGLGLEYNQHIRNIDNGSVFCRNNIHTNPLFDKISIDAVSALELDFGAVDLLAIYEEEVLKDAVVCEVNTAPNLTGTTLTRYVEAFKKYTSQL